MFDNIPQQKMVPQISEQDKIIVQRRLNDAIAEAYGLSSSNLQDFGDFFQEISIIHDASLSPTLQNFSVILLTDEGAAGIGDLNMTAPLAVATKGKIGVVIDSQKTQISELIHKLIARIKRLSEVESSPKIILLVDGFLTNGKTGSMVIEEIPAEIKENIIIIAFSSDSDMNQRMINCGAKHKINKSMVLKKNISALENLMENQD